jgi:phosphodiesterase/alkaline phosphatase D-like protein
VARDERLRDVVRTGTDVARAEHAHSVHVEVEGLEPGRPYWYQFTGAGGLPESDRTHPDRSRRRAAARIAAARRHLVRELATRTVRRLPPPGGGGPRPDPPPR